MADKTQITTRELHGDIPVDDSERLSLFKIFQQTNQLTKRAWQQFGSLAMGTTNKYSRPSKTKVDERGSPVLPVPNAQTIDTSTSRKNGVNNGFRTQIDIHSQIEKATFQDVLNDIKACFAATITAIIKLIYKKTSDKNERKQLVALLKSGKWQQNPWLHNQVRKAFPHGVRTATNNFSLNYQSYRLEIVKDINSKDTLVLVIKTRKSDGPDIRIVLNSTGKGILFKQNGSVARVKKSDPDFDISKCNIGNIRIMYVESTGMLRILYGKEVISRDTNLGIVGIDKGRTEAFFDSNGNCFGEGLGKLLTEYSDYVCDRNKNRNKIKAQIKNLKESGQTKKAARMEKNNAGSKSYDKAVKRYKEQINQLISKAVHQLFQKYNDVVVEDLSWTGCKSNWGKSMNHKLNMWCKGVLQQTLETVALKYGANITLVNSAYTSQVDHKTGNIPANPLGRSGDTFKHKDGTRSHADINAAKNILARKNDSEIELHMPYAEVKKILMKR